VVLYAKRQMVDDDPQGADRKLLDLLAKAMSPDPQLLHSERLEHLLLFNLFGDPLLRLKYPHTVQMEVADKALAGTHLEVQGNSPMSGRCRVVLVCRRDRMREDPPPRQRYDRSQAAQLAFNSTYSKANDRCWSQREIVVEGGSFLTALKIPPEARGACHVCVFLENNEGREFALGSSDIYISAPKLASVPVQASLEDHDIHDEARDSNTIDNTIDRR
jgi:hypothetical protein